LAAAECMCHEAFSLENHSQSPGWNSANQATELPKL
jgi:hypothetical protein